MADEQTCQPFNKPSKISPGLDWQSLLSKDGAEPEEQYCRILESLGKGPGMLGVIFRKSQSKIQDPAKLRRLVELINGETWADPDVDVKGAICEGLLEKNAEDAKGGAGRYFTPRPLIRAIVEVERPKPGEIIYDPACGTGGFLLAAYNYLSDRKRFDLDIEQKQFLLISYPDNHYDLVLTNPPFGKMSSVTIVNGESKADREALSYNRQDFWATTSNKQLNFLQHVRNLLKINGRAAIRGAG